jgi:hypothetical protein
VIGITKIDRFTSIGMGAMATTFAIIAINNEGNFLSYPVTFKIFCQRESI